MKEKAMKASLGLIAALAVLSIGSPTAADPFEDLLLGAARAALGTKERPHPGDSIVRDQDANVRANEALNAEMEADFRKSCEGKNTIFCGAAVQADGTLGKPGPDRPLSERHLENTWPWILSFSGDTGRMLQQAPVIAEPLTPEDCEAQLPAIAQATTAKSGYDPDIVKLSDTQWTDYDRRFGLVVQVFYCGTMTGGNRMQLLPGRAPPQPLLKEARAAAPSHR